MVYLAHHGILGQKWGIRRYQNEDGSLTSAGERRYGNLSTGKQITRKLNDYDKAIALNTRDYHDHSNAASIYKSRMDKLKNKGKENSKAYKKAERAYDKQNAKATEAANRIIEGRKYTDDLIKRAEANGLTVKAEATPRNVTRGSEYVAMIAVGTVGALLGSPIAVFQTHSVRGTQYKVKQSDPTSQNQNVSNKSSYSEYSKKDNSYNEKRNSYSDDAAKDLWERRQSATTKKEKEKAIKDTVKYARDTGMYDMEFFERNLDLDPDTDEQLKGKALDKAYANYLRNEPDYLYK